MSQRRIYLDNNASAPVRPEVIEIMTEVMLEGGNPSSVHKSGRGARARLDTARAHVAELVNALPPEVIFTSGGTEASDLAINGVAPANSLDEIVMTVIEHPAVRASASMSGKPITELPVTLDGMVDLKAAEKVFDRLAADGKTAFVCVMLANNETGVLQPVQEIGQMIRDRKIGLLHCDAVQAAGKVPVDAMLLGADTLALSSHKIGGPQGVGALIVREGVAISPRIAGGGQEMGRRSGTENVAGVAGFGKAAEVAVEHLATYANLARVRDRLETELRQSANDIRIFGEGTARLPNTCCFAAPGVSAETALMFLDLAGIEVSTGSACSSGKVAQNYVLSAMGACDAERNAALRVSLGWRSEETDVERFLEVWNGHIDQMKGF